MANGRFKAKYIAKANKCSIRYVFKLARKHPNMKFPPKGGSKRKLDAQTLHHLKVLFLTNQLSSPRQAKKYLSDTFSICVSETTLSTRLKETGLVCRKKKKKRPGLSEAQKAERLQFARKYKDWTADDWDQVLFVDEATVYTYDYFGNRYYWTSREIDKTYKSIIETQKFRGQSFKMWAGFFGANKTKVRSYTGTLNIESYIDILEEEVLPLAQGHRIMYLLHDKCTSHVSKKTSKWLSDNDIRTILLPTNSPDLNPIENLWCMLKQSLSRVNTKSMSKAQLEAATKAQWADILPEHYNNLIHSMPDRIREVLRHHGGQTRF